MPELRLVRRSFGSGSDFVALHLPAAHSQLNADALLETVSEGHRRAVMVAAVTEAAAVQHAAVAAGVDSIEHGAASPAPETLDLMAQVGCALVPALSLFKRLADVATQGAWTAASVMRSELELRCKTVAQAYAAGVPIAAGSGSGSALQTGIREELRLLRACGLPSKAVIAAATRNAAKVIGREHEVGALLVGRVADILVVDGDPEIDPTVIEGAADTAVVIHAVRRWNDWP